MKVLKKIASKQNKKEFLLLSGTEIEDSKMVLHLFIDHDIDEFHAKKVRDSFELDNTQWDIQKGYPFPWSIFYEFIKEGNSTS